jgi:hypothetical protein
MIIQAAIGWTDSHLHCFTAGDSRYGTDPDGELGMLAEDRHTLAAFASPRDPPAQPSTPSLPMSPDHPALTEDDVLSHGGWHPRYARVLAVTSDGDYGFALVDGNGDGAELVFHLALPVRTMLRPNAYPRRSSTGGPNVPSAEPRPSTQEPAA